MRSMMIDARQANEHAPCPGPSARRRLNKALSGRGVNSAAITAFMAAASG